MDWRNGRASTNVEVDCFGVRANANDPVARACFNEIGALRKSIAGTSNENLYDQVVKELVFSSPFKPEDLIKPQTMEEARCAARILRRDLNDYANRNAFQRLLSPLQEDPVYRIVGDIRQNIQAMRRRGR